MSAATDEARTLAKRAENDADSRDPWFLARSLSHAIHKLADEVDELARVIASRTDHLA